MSGDPRSLQAYLERPHSLAVVRPVVGTERLELFLSIDGDGQVTAFNGHVDLGTGIRTALAQIVAEELDVSVSRVTLVLGHTALAPDQGATIASETIQIAAEPLRRAAAQARTFLLGLAAEALDVPVAELRIEDGVVRSDRAGNARLGFGALLAGRSDRLTLDLAAPVKAAGEYRVVGTRVGRVDIPAKASGEWVYVHDIRLPDMLHGRVVLPPYAGVDCGDFVGTSLISVDRASVAGIPGVVAIVAIRDFVGVVALREEQAAAAAEQLRVEWRAPPLLPDLADLGATLGAEPSRQRTLLDRGQVDRRLAEAETRLKRTYVWPYQMHASIGPSCAVADYRPDGLTVWSGTQNPLALQKDLALLLAMPPDAIEIIRLEAAGCYGRNCADDAAADAALLSRAVGRPVRVQLTRAQEHLWEPKGAGQIVEVDGGLATDGSVAAYDFSTCFPSNAAVTLPLLLTGMVPAAPVTLEMGDRTAIPPYRYEHARVVVHDMAAIVRASWLRGVSALPNSFAHECYIDELAAAAEVDPVAFRLRYLDDARAADLLRAVAERAGWEARTGARRLPAEREGVTRGQGVAYARYVHGKFPGIGAAWSAWVAEVEVDNETGLVEVTRVVVGQDAGLVVNPAGIEHQIHGNVIQSVSRTLKEQVRFDRQAVAAREWGAYPILTFPEVPSIQIVSIERPGEPPLGAGESASIPSAGAIANAIYDATGLRLREPPFTPERVLAGLRAAKLASGAAPSATEPQAASWRRWFGAGLGAALGLAVTLLPLRAAIAPVAPPDPELYSATTIARGRELAALGDCAVCHTAEGGAVNAGGRALATPFGTIYATNITPDPETGIGAWSFAAFERAMRQGIHRDGRHLYPAFPYTAFAKVSETDLQALYAYLMAAPPVRAVSPETKLRFPFGMRAGMAVWNALFLRPGEFRADPARSEEWNRGAYLVEGLGHCGGCHSPRNALGAEASGARYLSGGVVDGWEAPALSALSRAPVPWTAPELFAYLRTGRSALHGAAAGPMAPVVASLASVSDADLWAMARYLASLQKTVQPAEEKALAEAVQSRATARAGIPASEGARLYQGACAVCHEADPSGTRAAAIPLALATSLHSPRPDNVLNAILDGVAATGAANGTEAMPAFRGSLDNRQLAELLRYLRARFAGDQAAWAGGAAIATERASIQP